MTKLKAMFFAVMMSITVNAGAMMDVIDPAAILAAIENALNAYDQAVKNYEKLTSTYNQLQQLERIASGQTKFTDILSNELLLDALPEDLSDATRMASNSSEYFQLRRKCPDSKNPGFTESCYLAAQLIVINKMFLARSKQRERRIERLKREIAEFPNERQDKQQKIQNEIAELENDTSHLNRLSLSFKDKMRQHHTDGMKTKLCTDWTPNPAECK